VKLDPPEMPLASNQPPSMGQFAAKPTSGRAHARWVVAAFVALAAALNYADRAALSAVLSAIRTDLQVSDVSLGLLNSAFLWSYAIGSPLAGHVADRFSRRKLVVISLVVWSAVTALIGLANDFASLLILRIALGIAECFFLPAAVALVAEYHLPATRARAMSLLTIGINSGMVFGGSFAGFMAGNFGWRSGFLALGFAGLAMALLVKPCLPPSPAAATSVAPRASFGDAIRYLARVPSYYVLLIESMLSGLGMWIFFSWLPLYFKESYNMSLAAAGFSGTFMLQISVVLGAMAGGWISDRVATTAPHRRMLLYSLFYLGAAPFLLLFLGRPEFTIVAMGLSAFSFLRGVGQANDNPTQCEIVPPQFRSTGVGIMNAIATASGGCGVLLAGVVKEDVGLEHVFAGISGVFMVAGIALFAGYRFFMRRDIARAEKSTLRPQLRA
jgi:MFS transporter, Spinster family, sphingosine-1-phosphate transporter